MQIIDFHTHIFPERIAQKTISLLAENCKERPHIDGTRDGLERSMEESGVTTSVILPVMTSPAQFDSIHAFASQFMEGKMISFGGIHPACENYKELLRTIKSMGFCGIKLHPDYQGTYIEDIRYKRILSYASELDLAVTVHAGIDPKCPTDIHCPPHKALEVIEEVRPMKLILAHMGGNGMYDEVERYLIGAPVYFDTGYVLDKTPKDQLIRMIRNHGVDKILFASDSPWGGQAEFVNYFDTLDLTEDEKNKILYANALRLLEI